MAGDDGRYAARRTGSNQGDRLAVSAASVGQEFREIRFKDATGVIGLGTSRVGGQRNLALLEIADIHDFAAVPQCTQLIGDLYEAGQKTSVDGCLLSGAS